MNSSNKTPKVIVIIVNWQRPDDTIECLNSVFSSDYENFEVVLVDNGSQDDSVNRIHQAFPDINILEIPANLGFTGGYNAGIEFARKIRASYYFLLNNDTVIDKYAIRFLASSGWDVSIPKITYYGSPELIWSAGARWRAFPPTIKMIGYRKEDNPIYNRPYPLEYATGCALMIREHVFEIVSGFDPVYQNYMEDYEFSYQVRAAGFQMGYVPEALIQHKESQTLGINSPQRWQLLGRNTVIFYRKSTRFPGYTLWSVMGWIILREIVQGNLKYLPSFWQGVQEGWNIVKRINQ
ncbi:MAG: glycosyltransferase family 2 protein [Chloroflexota bacterium]|nr:MAG: glycosyltransferase family 2 protein [Chloroflexota bacterium]